MQPLEICTLDSRLNGVLKYFHQEKKSFCFRSKIKLALYVGWIVIGGVKAESIQEYMCVHNSLQHQIYLYHCFKNYLSLNPLLIRLAYAWFRSIVFCASTEKCLINRIPQNHVIDWMKTRHLVNKYCAENFTNY